MKNALRFSYVFLESLFKKINDDGFAPDKAVIVLSCAQVALAFSVMNALVILGVRLPNPTFGFGIAFVLGLLLVVANNRMIKGDGNLESYRERYRQLPKPSKVLGGVTVIALLVLSIVAVIVTSRMAAPLRSVAL